MEQDFSTPSDLITNATNRRVKSDRRAARRRMLWAGFRYLMVIAITYGCSQFCHRHVIQTVQVEGVSMSPTLPDHNCYLLNRVAYLVREPQPADIVVLRDPEMNGFVVKRIVAKPGDSVYLAGGRLYVNGKVQSESYLERGTKTYTSAPYPAQMWICGVDQYFVLGDNRNNSTDSRVYGAVPRQNILGMVVP